RQGGLKRRNRGSGDRAAPHRTASEPEDQMGTATVEKVGIAGSVNGYTVLVMADTIIVRRDDVEIARTTVHGFGRFATSPKDLKLGWGRFPDDAEVIFVYDRADDLFGYALNLACDWCSEWGYALFSPGDSGREAA